MQPGDRVRMTAKGHKQFRPRSEASYRGTFVRYSRDKEMVYIKRDGLKNAQPWHASFWEPDPSAPSASSAVNPASEQRDE